ncbi:hypothetical protein [Rhodococcus jostii]|uniref:Uncharacterized protein n=1 Tax=Rhodococcus jostii TaxID=132919 RepID=A0A1H5GMG2_RHOJO|nr:hypothetical protein [Rhodococcus jostii]SEE16907.1 hypothetical protein SAMN04490220_6868 [Rhodococcus jostii]
MTFRISHLCLLPIGFVAGIALTSSMSGRVVFVTDADLDVFWLGPAARGALAAIVAVLVAAHVRSRRGLSVASFAGLALLGVAPSIGPLHVEMYASGVGAGLLLGGLVGLCATADACGCRLRSRRAWLPDSSLPNPSTNSGRPFPAATPTTFRNPHSIR